MAVWEKVRNIIHSELIYNNKYLKVEKTFQHKRYLSMFLYTSNIL